MPEDESEGTPLVNVQITDLLGAKHLGKALEKATSNIVNAIGRGIGWISDPLMKRLMAKTDAYATETLAIAEARTKVIEALGDTLAAEVRNAGENDDISSAGLANRALLTLSDNLVRNQKNREAIAQQSLEEMRRLVDADEQEITGDIIEDDWISYFWKTVENTTDHAMQSLFARILAGEAFRPGSFSPQTIQVVSLMTPKCAESFKRACTLAFHSEELGTHILEAAIEYAVPEIDRTILDPEEINDLESIGILARGTSYSFDSGDDGVPVWVGDKKFTVRIESDAKAVESENALCAAPFASPGEELRRIATFEHDNEYITGLGTVLQGYGITLEPV